MDLYSGELPCVHRVSSPKWTSGGAPMQETSGCEQTSSIQFLKRPLTCASDRRFAFTGSIQQIKAQQPRTKGGEVGTGPVEMKDSAR